MQKFINFRGERHELHVIEVISKKQKWLKSTLAAKKVLRKGDRIRVSRCGGILATYTFECWDGNWIISKSGINDLSASSISKLNGKPINFGRIKCWKASQEII